MKVAIIGAGPAGITAAYELSKNGVKVEVFEAGGVPGGMARTIELWNQRVDLGPHRFFSKDKRVNELWLEVVGNDYQIINRLTRIHYQNKFYDYPLSAVNAFNNIGVLQSALCILYYLKELVWPTKQDGSFEAWVTRSFGKRLYEIFFKPYSEKLWGIPCAELDSDFASQRIKKLSLLEVIKNAFFRRKVINNHRTLLEQFAYPSQGSGVVYQRMGDFIQKHAGKIHYHSPVEKIVIDGEKRSVVLSDGREFSGYDHLISTMPLSLLTSRLKDVPENVKKAALSLRFRNTILVYLKIEAVNLFKDQWIYVQSTDFKVGRITNFRNWTPELYGLEQDTILVMEYWCNDEDAIWHDSTDNLIGLASDELASIGFLKDKITGGHVERIPKCYPIYCKGYKETIKIIKDYLNIIPGLSVIGRYGAFKYNNQDHSILMGLKAADNILYNEKNDLWAINSDFDEYQESYFITKTGLIKG